jgi:hypothetical protein
MPERFFYDPNTEWLCFLCGCDNVRVRQWIGINSGDAVDGTEGDDVYYCPKCNIENVKVVMKGDIDGIHND